MHHKMNINNIVFECISWNQVLSLFISIKIHLFLKNWSRCPILDRTYTTKHGKHFSTNEPKTPLCSLQHTLAKNQLIHSFFLIEWDHQEIQSCDLTIHQSCIDKNVYSKCMVHCFKSYFANTIQIKYQKQTSHIRFSQGKNFKSSKQSSIKHKKWPPRELKAFTIIEGTSILLQFV